MRVSKGTPSACKEYEAGIKKSLVYGVLLRTTQPMLDMIAHDFNPCSQEAEIGRSPEFEVSLVYTSSKPARATVRYYLERKKQQKTIPL